MFARKESSLKKGDDWKGARFLFIYLFFDILHMFNLKEDIKKLFFMHTL